MRDRILKKLAYWHAVFPWRMLSITTIITIVFISLTGRLSITMRTSDLLPEKDPRVVQFNKIIDEFLTATNLVVVVQGEEDQIKDFADTLAPKIVALRDSSLNKVNMEMIQELQKEIRHLNSRGNQTTEIRNLRVQIDELKKRINMPLFQRVDYKTDVDFLRNHSLMLIKEGDLDNMKDIYLDPNLTGLITNINNSLEKEYVGREESISTREEEDGAVAFLDGIESLVLKLQQVIREENCSKEEIHKTVDKLLLGEPYMLSYDRTAVVMIAVPNFTIMDRDLIMIATKAVQEVLDEQLEAYPNVRAGLTGDIAKEHDEQLYSEKALSFSTLIALVVILILLIISFRMWLAPIFALITLSIGVIWALGASVVIVGQLNMVTSMMAVVLLGLGIDFAIHFISGFTEWRTAGDSISLALEKTFLKSGKGIITGALTTACAFFTLMISQSRGMKEMGVVIGIGLICILLSTVLFLPILLVFRERRREKKAAKVKFIKRDISFRFLGDSASWLSKRYILTIAVSVLLTLFFLWNALQLTFDHDFRNIEPKGLTSIALMDTVLEKFDLSIQYAFILADNIEESRSFAKQCSEMSSVAITSDISVYLPSEEEQQKRIRHINDIRKHMITAKNKTTVSQDELPILGREIDRLQMNIIEMQDMAFLSGKDKVDNKCKQIVGDPDKLNSRNIIQELLVTLGKNNPRVAQDLSLFQLHFAPYYQQSVLKMSSTEPIELSDLPPTIIDSYCNKRRDQFLVTVYPAGDMWQKDNLYRFAEQLERVSEKSTGAAPVAIALIRIFGRDGRNAILLTLFIVFLLLLVDFKGIKYSLIAMLPLACGVLWMVGLMNLVGMKLTIMNFIGLPMIIGIGIDDGVHIMHRWRHEGNGKIHTVFSSTGKAILLTSITTGFAFGSLLFSAFPGWAQFGSALFIGVSTCFLSTVLILPGILGIIERKT